MRAAAKCMKRSLFPICLLLGLLAGLGPSSLAFAFCDDFILSVLGPSERASEDSEEERSEKEGKKGGEDSEEDSTWCPSCELDTRLASREHSERAYGSASRDGFRLLLLRPPLAQA